MSIVPVLFGSQAKPTADWLSLDSWDPFDISPLSSMLAISGHGLRLDNVPLDWKETPAAHVLMADLPGLKKDEVKVVVEEQRFLKICGERSREVENKNDKWRRVGRPLGRFLASIPLPEDATVGAAKAVLENGVLTVTVPKSKDNKVQPRVIQIEG